MTEAEVREIIDRYEGLVRTVIAAAGPFELPDFEISLPLQITEGAVVLKENVEGDAWRLRQARMQLS